MNTAKMALKIYNIVNPHRYGEPNEEVLAEIEEWLAAPGGIDENVTAVELAEEWRILEAEAERDEQEAVAAAAAALGRIGGQSTSAAKATAARENGKRGGRPRKNV